MFERYDLKDRRTTRVASHGMNEMNGISKKGLARDIFSC